MNITLSADPDLVRKSRQYAEGHHTSLNQLIRDYLRSLVAPANSEQNRAEEVYRLLMSIPASPVSEPLPRREDLYDRKAFS